MGRRRDKGGSWRVTPGPCYLLGMLDPTESPIERALLEVLEKRLASDVTIEPQRTFETRFGTFRPDFTLSRGSTRVAIECDGEEFHDAHRDEWRDAMLLGEGCLSSILRIPGKGIHGHPEDCVYMVSRLFPWAFSSQGAYIVGRLANPDAVECIENHWGNRSKRTDLRVVAYRATRNQPERCFVNYFRTQGAGQFWEKFHKFSTEGRYSDFRRAAYGWWKRGDPSWGGPPDWALAH